MWMNCNSCQVRKEKSKINRIKTLDKTYFDPDAAVEDVDDDSMQDLILQVLVRKGSQRSIDSKPDKTSQMPAPLKP